MPSTIGWYHTLLGDHHHALDYCRQALELLRVAGDPIAEASAWDSAGLAHLNLGQHEDAISCLRHASQMFANLADRYNEADTTAHLGDAYASAGDRDRARDCWNHALRILEDLGHAAAAEVRARIDAPPPAPEKANNPS